MSLLYYRCNVASHGSASPSIRASSHTSTERPGQEEGVVPADLGKVTLVVRKFTEYYHHLLVIATKVATGLIPSEYWQMTLCELYVIGIFQHVSSARFVLSQ